MYDISDWFNSNIKEIKYSRIINPFLFNSLLYNKDISTITFNTENLSEILREFKDEFFNSYNKYISLKKENQLFNVENNYLLTLIFLNEDSLNLISQLYNSSKIYKKVKIIFLRNLQGLLLTDKSFFAQLFEISLKLKKEQNIDLVLVDRDNKEVSLDLLNKKINYTLTANYNDKDGFNLMLYSLEEKTLHKILSISPEILRKIIDDSQMYYDEYFNILQNLQSAVILFNTKFTEETTLFLDFNIKSIKQNDIEYLINKIVYFLYVNSGKQFNLISCKKSLNKHITNSILQETPIGYSLRAFLDIFNNPKKFDLQFINQISYNLIDKEELLNNISIYCIKIDNLYYTRNLRTSDTQIKKFSLYDLTESKDFKIFETEELLFNLAEKNVLIKYFVSNYDKSKNENPDYKLNLFQFIDMDRPIYEQRYTNFDILYLLSLIDIMETNRVGFGIIPNQDSVVQNIFNIWANLFRVKGVFTQKENIFFLKDTKKGIMYLASIDNSYRSLINTLVINSTKLPKYLKCSYPDLICSLKNKFKYTRPLRRIIGGESVDLLPKNRVLNLATRVRNYFERNSLSFEMFTKFNFPNKGQQTNDFTYKLVGNLSFKNRITSYSSWYTNYPVGLSLFLEPLEMDWVFFNRILSETYLTLLVNHRAFSTEQQPTLPQEVRRLNGITTKIYNVSNRTTIDFDLESKI